MLQSWLVGPGAQQAGVIFMFTKFILFPISNGLIFVPICFSVKAWFTIHHCLFAYDWLVALQIGGFLTIDTIARSLSHGQ